jgi:hypothetical protein
MSTSLDYQHLVLAGPRTVPFSLVEYGSVLDQSVVHLYHDGWGQGGHWPTVDESSASDRDPWTYSDPSCPRVNVP